MNIYELLIFLLAAAMQRFMVICHMLDVPSLIILDLCILLLFPLVLVHVG